MKKVAIATSNQVVAEHFGHCEGFTVYTLTGDLEQAEKKFLPNPGHKPGFLPNFLHEQGVGVIIASGMGSSAVEIFQERGIDVITGAKGAVDEVIRAFSAGSLLSSGAVCHEHQNNDNC